MSRARRFLTALRSALSGSALARPRSQIAGPVSVPAAPPAATPAAPGAAPHSPRSGPRQPTPLVVGRTGPDATVELDPAGVRHPLWGYAPENDGALDPGEIVWTWVPYEERDGRGKDRPVIVVATLAHGNVLAVQLTSKDHSGDTDYVDLGVGAWDREQRPSWAGLGRVFQVSPAGVRREGAAVDAGRYRLIVEALRRRYGWT